MGILAVPARRVETLIVPHLEPGFSVCELGNQLYRAGGAKEPAQGWYERLGCGRYVTVDGNGEATVLADLNEPLNLDELGTFDVVTDFGTGEHIFNQAQVWRTLHDLAKPGGYIVVDRPRIGWDSHCFYSIHEVLIVDLAAANGYQLVHMETHAPEGREVSTHGTLLAIMLKLGENPFAYPQQTKYARKLKLS